LRDRFDASLQLN